MRRYVQLSILLPRGWPSMKTRAPLVPVTCNLAGFGLAGFGRSTLCRAISSPGAAIVSWRDRRARGAWTAGSALRYARRQSLEEVP
ncbi:hypothetical protein [Sorangium sp. So ce1153]|uniref:hypothetical protein n=1 Tax=Sorangium sp. So ce1153 TaxID=3133333 RepID=UPI003F6311F6